MLDEQKKGGVELMSWSQFDRIAPKMKRPMEENTRFQSTDAEARVHLLLLLDWQVEVG